MPSKTHERYFKPVSRKGFSSAGTSRSQGRVGQTSLSRSLVHTPFRGAEPIGTGGCCGTYTSDIVNSCSSSTQSNGYSSMTSKGVFLSRVINPTSVYNESCNSDCAKNFYLNTSPLNNSASAHTKDKVNYQMAKCYAKRKDAGMWSCDTDCGVGGYYIGGKYFQFTPYAKPTNILGAQEYQSTALAKKTCMNGKIYE